MLPTAPGPVMQMSMEVWIILCPPWFWWHFEFFFNWLCQFCIKLRSSFHFSCYLILSSNVFFAHCNCPYFLPAVFIVYIQLSHCIFLSALGKVIYRSNNWSGCRLPSNTDVSNGFQIREAYSYLLFCIFISLFSVCLILEALLLFTAHSSENPLFNESLSMYSRARLHKILQMQPLLVNKI